MDRMCAYAGREGGPAPGRQPLRVLLVQKDPWEAEWTQRRIIGTSIPAEVMRVSTLAEAFASLAERPVDAVFLDLQIAEDLSADTCRRIVEASGRPVIALAQRGDPGGLERALAAGLSGFYYKRRTARGIFQRGRPEPTREPAVVTASLTALAVTAREARAHG
jgi:DNA-binding NarL/FixJ family response regulator